jgi:hypothetical protein
VIQVRPGSGTHESEQIDYVGCSQWPPLVITSDRPILSKSTDSKCVLFAMYLPISYHAKIFNVGGSVGDMVEMDLASKAVKLSLTSFSLLSLMRLILPRSLSDIVYFKGSNA